MTRKLTPDFFKASTEDQRLVFSRTGPKLLPKKRKFLVAERLSALDQLRLPTPPQALEELAEMSRRARPTHTAVDKPSFECNVTDPRIYYHEKYGLKWDERDHDWWQMKDEKEMWPESQEDLLELIKREGSCPRGLAYLNDLDHSRVSEDEVMTDSPAQTMSHEDNKKIVRSDAINEESESNSHESSRVIPVKSVGIHEVSTAKPPNPALGYSESEHTEAIVSGSTRHPTSDLKCAAQHTAMQPLKIDDGRADQNKKDVTLDGQEALNAATSIAPIGTSSHGPLDLTKVTTVLENSMCKSQQPSAHSNASDDVAPATLKTDANEFGLVTVRAAYTPTQQPISGNLIPDHKTHLVQSVQPETRLNPLNVGRQAQETGFKDFEPRHEGQDINGLAGVERAPQGLGSLGNARTLNGGIPGLLVPFQQSSGSVEPQNPVQLADSNHVHSHTVEGPPSSSFELKTGPNEDSGSNARSSSTDTNLTTSVTRPTSDYPPVTVNCPSAGVQNYENANAHDCTDGIGNDRTEVGAAATGPIGGQNATLEHRLPSERATVRCSPDPEQRIRRDNASDDSPSQLVLTDVTNEFNSISKDNTSASQRQPAQSDTCSKQTIQSRAIDANDISPKESPHGASSQHGLNSGNASMQSGGDTESATNQRLTPTKSPLVTPAKQLKLRRNTMPTNEEPLMSFSRVRHPRRSLVTTAKEKTCAKSLQNAINNAVAIYDDGRAICVPTQGKIDPAKKMSVAFVVDDGQWKTSPTPKLVKADSMSPTSDLETLPVDQSQRKASDERDSAGSESDAAPSVIADMRNSEKLNDNHQSAFNRQNTMKTDTFSHDSKRVDESTHIEVGADEITSLQATNGVSLEINTAGHANSSIENQVPTLERDQGPDGTLTAFENSAPILHAQTFLDNIQQQDDTGNNTPSLTQIPSDDTQAQQPKNAKIHQPSVETDTHLSVHANLNGLQRQNHDIQALKERTDTSAVSQPAHHLALLSSEHPSSLLESEGQTSTTDLSSPPQSHLPRLYNPPLAMPLPRLMRSPCEVLSPSSPQIVPKQRHHSSVAASGATPMTETPQFSFSTSQELPLVGTPYATGDELDVSPTTQHSTYKASPKPLQSGGAKVTTQLNADRNRRRSASSSSDDPLSLPSPAQSFSQHRRASSSTMSPQPAPSMTGGGLSRAMKIPAGQSVRGLSARDGRITSIPDSRARPANLKQSSFGHSETPFVGELFDERPPLRRQLEGIDGNASSVSQLGDTQHPTRSTSPIMSQEVHIKPSRRTKADGTDQNTKPTARRPEAVIGDSSITPSANGAIVKDDTPAPDGTTDSSTVVAHRMRRNSTPLIAGRRGRVDTSAKSSTTVIQPNTKDRKVRNARVLGERRKALSQSASESLSPAEMKASLHEKSNYAVQQPPIAPNDYKSQSKASTRTSKKHNRSSPTPSPAMTRGRKKAKRGLEVGEPSTIVAEGDFDGENPRDINRGSSIKETQPDHGSNVRKVAQSSSALNEDQRDYSPDAENAEASPLSRAQDEFDEDGTEIRNVGGANENDTVGADVGDMAPNPFSPINTRGRQKARASLDLEHNNAGSSIENKGMATKTAAAGGKARTRRSNRTSRASTVNPELDDKQDTDDATWAPRRKTTRASTVDPDCQDQDKKSTTRKRRAGSEGAEAGNKKKVRRSKRISGSVVGEDDGAGK